LFGRDCVGSGQFSVRLCHTLLFSLGLPATALLIPAGSSLLGCGCRQPVFCSCVPPVASVSREGFDPVEHFSLVHGPALMVAWDCLRCPHGRVCYTVWLISVSFSTSWAINVVGIRACVEFQVTIMWVRCFPECPCLACV
jgi:hypothetical protein